MANRKAFKYRGAKCLNCEIDLDKSEKYCHHCGQLNSTKKLTLRDFIDEFFANFYAYDSRLKNTFITLFTKPGIAAKEFVEGKRHKHANPFRLFLSAAIFLFILIKISSNSEVPTKNEDDLFSTKMDSIKKNSSKIDTTKTIITKEIGGTTIRVTDNKVNYNFDQDSIYTQKDLEKNEGHPNSQFFRISSMRNYYLKNPTVEPKKALEKLGYDSGRINQFIYEKAKSLKSNDVKREIQDFFMSNLPFLIFLAVPFIAIMFWIVFYDKKFNYTDHLVFTYSFYSFILIMMIFSEILSNLSENISQVIDGLNFLIIFPFYLYKSLRNFYQNNRWKTIFKFILLNILFIPISIITVLVLFFISLILF